MHVFGGDVRVVCMTLQDRKFVDFQCVCMVGMFGVVCVTLQDNKFVDFQCVRMVVMLELFV